MRDKQIGIYLTIYKGYELTYPITHGIRVELTLGYYFGVKKFSYFYERS